jgi:N-acyl-L-homoserine lactone synthetase
MIHSVTNLSRPGQDAVLRNMFEARKRVFVDLLRWDIPVLSGKFEIDQFDSPDATYIIVADAHGGHRASARLLPTTQPHILDTLFAPLCDEDIPRGAGVREITRFCLERSLCAKDRRSARDELVHALVAHALANGITHYTGVAEARWLEQIVAFGWRCRPLGATAVSVPHGLGAVLIEIDAETPDRLERAGLLRRSAERARHAH